MHLQINTFQKPNDSAKKISSTKINPSNNNFKELLKNASMNSNALSSLATNLNAMVNMNSNAGINNLVNNRNSLKNNLANDSPNGLHNNLSNSLSNGLSDCLQKSSNEQTGNKMTNKELNSNSPIANAYLKQINRLNKSKSMITAANLNSLVCNNFNYLADNLTKNCGGSLDNLSSKMNSVDTLLNEESCSLNSLEEIETDEMENNSMIIDKYLLDKKDTCTNNGQINERISNHSTEFRECKLEDQTNSNNHVDGFNQIKQAEKCSDKRKFNEDNNFENDFKIKRFKKEQLSDDEENMENESK